ncbi:MAG: thioredoxin family protein [Firmicutes bacterium]|nr:thioredoxin family protein [Bacillota bacterium]MCL5014843.1 thioredoxin family protein [Bacillota bacterium]HBQ94214.1 hypothetical protein [Sulfobacillus sp.]
MKGMTLVVVTKNDCSGCELMYRKTLSSAEVEQELEAKWEVHSVDEKGPHGITDLIWYPTTVAYDRNFAVLRREEGFIPAYEFMVFLRLAEARELLNQHAYENSRSVLMKTWKTYPLSGLMPECLYYIGVASHLNQEPRQTARIWRILRDKYPAASWAHKAMLQWPPKP